MLENPVGRSLSIPSELDEKLTTDRIRVERETGFRISFNQHIISILQKYVERKKV